MAVLDPHLVYQGVVTRAYGKTYDVMVEDEGVELQGCVSALGVALSIVGVNTDIDIPVATRVMVLGTVPPTILATCPTTPANPASSDAFAATTLPDSASKAKDTGPENAQGYLGARADRDTVTGEVNMQNILGQGLQVLLGLVKLKASERAKVEAFLVDDLVRVVTGSFSFMSAFGNFDIQNDNGHVTCIHHGTSQEHEAWGQLDPQAPKAPVQDYMVGEVAEAARRRFTQYVGWLGDFIHTFVTDPEQMVGALNQDRAGKYRHWVGTDGSTVVSSVADIVFEHVARVVVPQQLKEHDDPEGSKKPNPEFLTAWTINSQQPWQMAFQLRDYARWLSNHHAYATFLRQPEDWAVTSEANAPVPKLQSGDPARARATPEADQTLRTTYSCYRLMRDGSTVTLDGYGGCSMHAGGSIYVSAPLDLHLQAGRDVVVQAGRNFIAKAYRHVELVAVTGAFLAKARTLWRGLCEDGTMLLRTLMKTGNPEETSPATHRFTDQKLAIVLEAPNANVLVSAGLRATVEGGFIDEEDDVKPGVELRTDKGEVLIRTGDEGSIKMRTSKALFWLKRWTVMAQTYAKIQTASLNIADSIYRRGGKTFVGSLFAKSLFANTITSTTPVPGKRMPGVDTKPVPPHINHVAFSDDASRTDVPEPPEEELADAEQVNQIPGSSSVRQARTSRVLSDYLPPAEYGIEPLDQSLAQQIMEQAPQHPSGASFDPWDQTLDGERGDPDAVYKLPWPGQQGRMRRYTSQQDLYTLCPQTAAELLPNRADRPETALPVFLRWRAPS